MNVVLFSPCIISPPQTFTCGTSTVSDIDGNLYNTVLIVTQCWTKENLKVSRYNNGDLISLDSTGGYTGTSASWNGLTFGARSIYGNDLNNLLNYGYLYNLYTGKDVRGVCPIGWHVPSQNEALTLINFLGGFAVAGGVN